MRRRCSIFRSSDALSHHVLSSDTAPLLLVGDVAQLPPIGFGLTLHRLVECGAIPKTELTRILRADEATGIPKTSSAIRRGEPVLLPRYRAARMGCSFITAIPEEIRHRIEDVLNDLRDEEVQIVAASYAGPAGIAPLYGSDQFPGRRSG
jgi:exodeoxyribonuclease V alpha subunit